MEITKLLIQNISKIIILKELSFPNKVVISEKILSTL